MPNINRSPGGNASVRTVRYTTTDDRRIVKAVNWVERQTDGTPHTRTNRQPLPFQFRRFELKEELTRLNDADAYLLIKVGTGNNTYEIGRKVNEDQSDFIFNVEDVLNIFFGAAGDRGYAIKMHDNPFWEVTQLACSN